MALSYLILLPFIGSAIAALLPANARNTESTLAGAISVFCAVQVALLFPETQNNGVVHQNVAWLGQLGLDLHFRMDGFAWMFSILVLGIGSLVVLYARYRAGLRRPPERPPARRVECTDR